MLSIRNGRQPQLDNALAWPVRLLAGHVQLPQRDAAARVLPPLSVGEMTLRLYGALSYSPNSARDLRCALNGA